MAAVLLVTGACIGSGILGYASATGTVATDTTLSTSAHDVAASFPAPAEAETAIAALQETYQAKLARMTAEQERLMRELQAARERRAKAVSALAETEEALESATAELDRASVELAELRSSRSEDGERELDAEALAAAQAELASLRLDLAAAQSAKQGLGETLDTFARTMEKVIAERDDAASRAEKMDEEIGALAAEQDRRLEALEEAARVSLNGMRKLFGKTDLDVERILDQTRADYTGSGGPFEALSEDAVDGEGDIRLAAIMSDYEELNLLRYAAERLPIGSPVRSARRTSGFGPRRDPLGRGRAMHKGVDFAAPRGTPIYATADGVVTFSGRQRGYGNIVVISHPFGIETRYAHLNRLHVNVGERVERGDHIADMGSTGRSTGPHLHYEVRIDRKAVNPAKFIEAARDVL